MFLLYSYKRYHLPPRAILASCCLHRNKWDLGDDWANFLNFSLLDQIVLCDRKGVGVVVRVVRNQGVAVWCWIALMRGDWQGVKVVFVGWDLGAGSCDRRRGIED